MKLRALRSKKNGHFFVWRELCEDGWGEHEATLSEKFIGEDEQPAYFSGYALLEENKHGSPWCTLKDHTPDEVEVVIFELMMEREVEALKTQLKDDIEDIAHLRDAGCECESPLLGYRPKVGPRCRLCNTVAKVEEPRC